MLITTKRDRVVCVEVVLLLFSSSFVFFIFFFLLSHVTFRYTFHLFSSMGESWEIFVFCFSYFPTGVNRKPNDKSTSWARPRRKLLTIVRVFVIRRRRTNLPEKGFQTRHILFKTWWAWQEKKIPSFSCIYICSTLLPHPKWQTHVIVVTFFLSLSLSLEKIRRLIFVRSS
jgi:hypothetical protein